MFNIVKVKNNYGMMSENQKKTKQTSPDFTGNLNVEGVIYNISCWMNEGDKGSKKFNLKIGRR